MTGEPWKLSGPGPTPSPWTSPTWQVAIDLALLFSDDDAVTGLLAIREAWVMYCEAPEP